MYFFLFYVPLSCLFHSPHSLVLKISNLLTGLLESLHCAHLGYYVAFLDLGTLILCLRQLFVVCGCPVSEDATEHPYLVCI